jgi:hypothetical protein
MRMTRDWMNQALMLKALPFDELFPADSPERLVLLNAIMPKVVRALKVNPKQVQALNNMKRNPLPSEFTPEHAAMFEIINAMMAGRLSVAGVSLSSLYH